MSEDINRIKTVLCEKKRTCRCELNSFRLILRQFQNGAPILLNLTYILFEKYHNFLKFPSLNY